MTVSLRVSDGELTDTETVAVSVTNVAPLAGVSENAPVQPTDAARSVTLTATDAAPADQAGSFTWSVDWGDGQSDSVTGTTPRTASHTYAAPGTYQVAVTARDDDGATSAAATQTITRRRCAGSRHRRRRRARRRTRRSPRLRSAAPAAHCSSSRPP